MTQDSKRGVSRKTKPAAKQSRAGKAGSKHQSLKKSKNAAEKHKFGQSLLAPKLADEQALMNNDTSADLASEPTKAAAGEKLHKVLASMGLGSRREIEEWIASGRVKVNDDLATVGQRVKRRDVIKVDGKVVERENQSYRRVLVYNKPEGEICTRNDPEGRRTVFDRLPKVKGERWIAVGRLDINTSGLLLFTTDGELAHRLMHPSTQSVDREYAVRIAGDVTDEMIKTLKKGVKLEDGIAHFSDIQFFDGDGFNKWYHVVIMEGRNREVRRLWESQGVTVSRLKRVRYGCAFLPKDVAVGTWREMKQKEVDDLADLVGLPSRPVPHIVGKEKADYQRKANKQKTRQRVGGKKPSNDSQSKKVTEYESKPARNQRKKPAGKSDVARKSPTRPRSR